MPFLAFAIPFTIKSGAALFGKFLVTTAAAATTAYVVDYAKNRAKQLNPSWIYRTEYEKERAKRDAQRDAKNPA